MAGMSSARRIWFTGPALLVLLGAVLPAGCRRDSAESALQAGIEALGRGEYGAAVDHLRTAARRRSDSASAYCNLGIAYWKLGRTEQAISAFTVASDLIRTDPTPLELLAQVHADAGRWNEAREVIKRLSNGMPDSPRILTWQAVLEYRAGESEAARELLQRALELQSDYAPALYNMGLLYRDLPGGKAAAVEYFTRYLEAPDDETYARMARDYLRPAEPPEASPPPETSAGKTEPTEPAAAPIAAPSPPAPLPEPSPARALMSEAAAAVRAEAYDKALILLNQAVAADPDYPDALWNLAVLQDSYLEQDEKAAKTYRRFAARFPRDPRARQTPKRVSDVPSPASRPAPTPATRRPQDEQADRTDAQEAWEKALQAQSTGNFDDAVEYYHAALKQDPGMNNAAFNLGLIYREQGNSEAAIDAFGKAIAANSNMPKAHYMLAVIYREMNEKTKAIKHAAKAVELKPDYARAHLILGFLYRSTLQYDWAREHFRSAVIHAPDRETAERARDWLDSTKGLKSNR